MRIVSLLPSATEIICRLDLQDQLVGVTHECDHPTSVKQLPRVTRSLIPKEASSAEVDALVREKLKTQRALYSLDLEAMEALQPDLIVTQALCAVCAVAESEVNDAACRLASKPKVVNLEPSRLAEVFDCIHLVANAAGVTDRGQDVVTELQARVTAVEERSRSITTPKRVVMLEWIDPIFCAGHWTPELVRMAGGIECVRREAQVSITTSWEKIVQADPDVIVVACCGYSIDRALQDLPVLRSYPDFQSLRCVQSGQLYFIDGNEYFNRPGPRLVDSLEILAHTLHPEVHSLPEGSPAAIQISNQ